MPFSIYIETILLEIEESGMFGEKYKKIVCIKLILIVASLIFLSSVNVVSGIHLHVNSPQKYEMFSVKDEILLQGDVSSEYVYPVDSISQQVVDILESLGYNNITFIDGYCTEKVIDNGYIESILERQYATTLNANNTIMNVFYTVKGEIIEKLTIAAEDRLYVVETPSVGLRLNVALENTEDVIENVLDIIEDVREKVKDTLKDVMDDVEDFIEVVLGNEDNHISEALEKLEKKIAKRIDKLGWVEPKIDLLYNLTKKYDLEDAIRQEILEINTMITQERQEITKALYTIQEIDEEIFWMALDVIKTFIISIEKIRTMLLDVILISETYVYEVTPYGLRLIIVIDSGGGQISPTPHDKIVECLVLYDEEFEDIMYADYLRDPISAISQIFEGADNEFESVFGINFVMKKLEFWWSPPCESLSELAYKARLHVNWDQIQGVLYEVLVIFTGSGIDCSILGLAPRLGTWVLVKPSGGIGRDQRTLRHEWGHTYGAYDHDLNDWWSMLTHVCVMSYFWCDLGVGSFCGECKSIINAYATRF